MLETKYYRNFMNFLLLFPLFFLRFSSNQAARQSIINDTKTYVIKSRKEPLQRKPLCDYLLWRFYCRKMGIVFGTLQCLTHENGVIVPDLLYYLFTPTGNATITKYLSSVIGSLQTLTVYAVY